MQYKEVTLTPDKDGIIEINKGAIYIGCFNNNNPMNRMVQPTIYYKFLEPVNIVYVNSIDIDSNLEGKV